MPTLTDLSQMSPESINDLAKNEGQKFVNIKVNQIRNIYSIITRIRNDFRHRDKGEYTDNIQKDLIILKPKLAYAAGRNEIVKPFQQLFDQAIDAVINAKDKAKALENFFFLAEAIVAYHKFYGAKEN